MLQGSDEDFILGSMDLSFVGPWEKNLVSASPLKEGQFSVYINSFVERTMILYFLQDCHFNQQSLLKFAKSSL